jgi:hypothetical protein
MAQAGRFDPVETDKFVVRAPSSGRQQGENRAKTAASCGF